MMTRSLRAVVLAAATMLAPPAIAQTVPAGAPSPPAAPAGATAMAAASPGTAPALPTSGAAQQARIDAMNNPWVTLANPLGAAARAGQYARDDGQQIAAARMLVHGHRDMTLMIWVPSHIAMNATLPIVLMSARIGLPPNAYQALAAHLATHGDVVIAPIHVDADGSTISASMGTTQSRIDDIHDAIRAIPSIAQDGGFRAGDGLACIGFAAGAMDCMMNGGIVTTQGALHPWNGVMASILAVAPQTGDIPEGYATLPEPILVVAGPDDPILKSGALAASPSGATRMLAKLSAFSEPLITINNPEDPQTFYWRSLVALWIAGTAGGQTAILQAMNDDAYGRYSNGAISTLAH